MNTSEKGDDICPISLECGLAVPRRSIDISRPQAAKAAAPARSGCSVQAASDWLDISSMMEHQPTSHGPGRMGSFNRFRSASGRASFGGNDKAGGVASPRTLQQDLAAALNSSTVAEQANKQQHSSEQLLQLAAACRARDARQLQQLLAAAPPVNLALDSRGNTALHLLLLPVCSPSEAVRLDASACSRGSSTHQLAVHREQLAGDRHHNGSGDRAGSSGAFGWLTACFTGNNESQLGLPRSSSLSFATHHTHSLSPAAAASAQLSMAAALLAAGASVNIRNRDGVTPLMLAAQQVTAAGSSCGSSSSSSALKVLELLVTKDSMADVNIKDAAGRTALVHVLAQQQADASTTGGSVRSEPVGRTASSKFGYGDVSISASVVTTAASAAAGALSAAAAAAQTKAVQLLVHHGADVNAADAAGMTPLMHAAAQPGVTKELLHKMLELGANSRYAMLCCLFQ